MKSRIHRLEDLGQSVWLDFLDRKLLTSGELEQLISEGLRGMTSNPTIFQKAISGSSDYDTAIRSAAASESDASVLERLMVRDLTLACDKLRPVYDGSDGADGFASIEVAPTLAGETAASIEAASRLWGAVNRPNLMVKIPGTRAGLRAIESCLTHGININVTLLFSVSRYREIIEAHLRALEHRVSRGEPIDRIASVASFFVSRVDTKVDKALDGLTVPGDALSLKGKIAIANAKLAFEEYETILASQRWKTLADKGARPARLLWASTSTKNPAYPPLLYVEALIGPRTVDTVTPETFRTYTEQGQPEPRIRRDLGQAHAQMELLARHGIDFEEVAAQLETEGVASFVDSFTKLLQCIADKRRSFTSPPLRP
ncbi:transaldolase [Labilithrix luteola]|nr:transaldolase [Labilithrix luteola]